MASIATAYVNIVPSMKGTSGKISTLFNKEGQSAGNHFSKGLQSAQGSAKGASIALGAVAGIASAVASKAFEVLAENVGAAVKRLDTLNNYPKVMSNLGYSSEEASRSIKTISDHLDGLPSTTDSIAQFVQGLAASTGNLDTATKAGLAFNDMMLAGGASSESAANAMSMFSRMVATGKYDAQQFESIISAAPGQMNMLAESILGAGKSGWDLQKALQSGTVSTDQLLDAMISLDENGTGSMESFSTQARAATDGVQTAMNNMGNRIAREMANVFDAIGQTNISGVINGISGSFKYIGEFIIGIINDVKEKLAGFDFSSVGNAFSNLGESFGRLMSVVQPLISELLSRAIPVLAKVAEVIANTATVIADILTPVIQFLSPIIVALMDVWELLNFGLLNFCDVILSVIDALANGGLAPLLQGITDAFTWLGDVCGSVATIIVDAWNAAVSFVGDLFNGWISLISSIFSLIFSIITGDSEGITESMKGIFDSGLGAVIGFFRDLPGNIVNALGNLGNLLVDAGKNIIDGLFKGIKDAVQGVFSFVGGIADKIASLKGPLPYDRKVLIPNGLALMQSLNTGIQKGLSPVLNTVTGIADSIEDTLASSMRARVVQKIGATVTADSDEFNRQNRVLGTQQVFNIYTNDPQLVAAQVAYKQRQALSLVNL